MSDKLRRAGTPAPEYPEELGRPIEGLTTLAPDGGPVVALQAGAEPLEIIPDHLRKLGLLLDHYGIKRDLETQWLMLAWTLACDHVPGFQLASPPAVRESEDMLAAIAWVACRQREGSQQTKSALCRTAAARFGVGFEALRKGLRRARQREGDALLYASRGARELMLNGKPGN